MVGKRTAKQSNFSETLPVGSTERSRLRSQLLPRVAHGGNPSLHRRKTARPFTAETAIHLVLKSNRAKGRWSLLHRKNRSKINSMIFVYADRFKVRVFRASNVGDHLHLLVKATERKHLADFLRVLAGRVAVTVTGAQKYVKRIGKFWDYLYWSKLINWGSAFYQVRKFVMEVKHPNATVESILEEWNELPEVMMRP